MEISSSNLNFRLSLADIDALKPHEEVIESSVRSLANDMQTEGLVRDPIIVDQEDFVILDGMHRFNSLKTLRCRFAPCCLLNYDSPQIRIGSWFRLFVVDEPTKLAERLLNEAQLTHSTQATTLENMNYHPHTIILVQDGAEFSLPENFDLLEQTRMAVKLEKMMCDKGHNVEYLSEIVAMERLRAGSGNFVISLPIFTKQQIREFGLQNRLLPHKVTRHIIPSRPLRIDVPLDLLRKTQITLEEANRKLGEMLASRHVDRKAPGSMVDGRRYQEELLVFS